MIHARVNEFLTNSSEQREMNVKDNGGRRRHWIPYPRSKTKE